MAAANDGDGTGTTAPLTMKLLIAPGWHPRVVFVEAGKDVVEFLFSLMAVPAVRLLGKDSVAVCMGNLYSSTEKLANGPYVQPVTTMPSCQDQDGPDQKFKNNKQITNEQN
jgi:hypothetical protein